jgi:hypothetical protein
VLVLHHTHFSTHTIRLSNATATLFGIVAVTPLRHTLPRIPRTEDGSNNILDVLTKGLTGPVSRIVNALPVDVSVDAPILPEKREAAINVNVGGASINIKQEPNKKQNTIININLRGISINI